MTPLILRRGRIVALLFGILAMMLINSSPAFATQTAGQTDGGFNQNISSGANAGVNDVVVQNNGKILVAGAFTQFAGVTANRLVRLNSDGTLDSNFMTSIGNGFNGEIYSLSLLTDGSIIAVGNFTSVSGSSANNVVKLSPSGIVDSAFLNSLSGGLNGTAYASARTSTNETYVGGAFTVASGISANRLVKIDANGTSQAVAMGCNNTVSALDTDASDNLYIGGSFTSCGGISTNRIAVFNGTTFSSISSGLNGNVNSLKVATNGDLFIGSAATSMGGASIPSNFVRITSTGAVVSAFSSGLGSGFNAAVTAIAEQSDGKVIVGGNFTSLNGQPVGRLVRLNADGTLDTTFMSGLGTGANDIVLAAGIQANGDILVAGLFSQIDGTVVNKVARIYGSTISPSPTPSPTPTSAELAQTGTTGIDQSFVVLYSLIGLGVLLMIMSTMLKPAVSRRNKQ